MFLCITSVKWTQSRSQISLIREFEETSCQNNGQHEGEAQRFLLQLRCCLSTLTLISGTLTVLSCPNTSCLYSSVSDNQSIYKVTEPLATFYYWADIYYHSKKASWMLFILFSIWVVVQVSLLVSQWVLQKEALVTWPDGVLRCAARWWLILLMLDWYFDHKTWENTNTLDSSCCN